MSLRQLSYKERARVTAPSVFTTANMACGFSAILLAFADEFKWSAALVALAIVMDICDGAVARAIGATSPFGVQLDSTADLVSFGLAPAVLVHTWAIPEHPVLAWFAAFFWLACAAFRLARFNFTVDPVDDKRYFIGLPSPGAAAVVIATIFALDSPSIDLGSELVLPVAISVVPAVLMVTTVRFRSFRHLLSPTTVPAKVTTIVVGLAVAGGTGAGAGVHRTRRSPTSTCSPRRSASSRRRSGRGCSGPTRSRRRAPGSGRSSSASSRTTRRWTT